MKSQRGRIRYAAVLAMRDLAGSVSIKEVV